MKIILILINFVTEKSFLILILNNIKIYENIYLINILLTPFLSCKIKRKKKTKTNTTLTMIKKNFQINAQILHPDLFKKYFNLLRKEITHGKYIIFTIDYNLIHLNSYTFPSERDELLSLLKPELYNKDLVNNNNVIINLHGRSVYNYFKHLDYFYLKRNKKLAKLIKKNNKKLFINQITFIVIPLNKDKYEYFKNSSFKKLVY